MPCCKNKHVIVNFRFFFPPSIFFFPKISSSYNYSCKAWKLCFKETEKTQTKTKLLWSFYLTSAVTPAWQSNAFSIFWNAWTSAKVKCFTMTRNKKQTHCNTSSVTGGTLSPTVHLCTKPSTAKKYVNAVYKIFNNSTPYHFTRHFTRVAIFSALLQCWWNNIPQEQIKYHRILTNHTIR